MKRRSLFVIVAVGVVALSVALLGVSGTAAVGIVAWLRADV